MTKHELEKRLAEQADRIAQLEEQNEDLEDEVNSSEWDNDEYRNEVGAHFAALCGALDDFVPLRGLPLRLQLDFEALAGSSGLNGRAEASRSCDFLTAVIGAPDPCKGQ